MVQLRSLCGRHTLTSGRRWLTVYGRLWAGEHGGETYDGRRLALQWGRVQDGTASVGPRQPTSPGTGLRLRRGGACCTHYTYYTYYTYYTCHTTRFACGSCAASTVLIVRSVPRAIRRHRPWPTAPFRPPPLPPAARTAGMVASLSARRLDRTRCVPSSS